MPMLSLTKVGIVGVKVWICRGRNSYGKKRFVTPSYSCFLKKQVAGVMIVFRRRWWQRALEEEGNKLYLMNLM